MEGRNVPCAYMKDSSSRLYGQASLPPPSSLALVPSASPMSGTVDPHPDTDKFSVVSDSSLRSVSTDLDPELEDPLPPAGLASHTVSDLLPDRADANPTSDYGEGEASNTETTSTISSSHTFPRSSRYFMEADMVTILVGPCCFCITTIFLRWC
jgi:hypothetical protein